MNPARTKCITRWKVAGAFEISNSIRKKWNKPYRVRKAVFCLSSSAMGICQYPEFISSVQSQYLPPKLSMHSSMRGYGYASLSSTEFNILKSMQYLQHLLCFLMSTSGETHSETLGLMTPAANMASKCYFSPFQILMGSILDLLENGKCEPGHNPVEQCGKLPNVQVMYCKNINKTGRNSLRLAACSLDNLVAATSHMDCRWAGNLLVSVLLASFGKHELPSTPF